MRTLAFISFILASALVRWLQWLALVQQKEYRFDRLWLFVRTPEGRRAITKWWPNLRELLDRRFKRPKLTARTAVTAAGSLLITLVYAVVWWQVLSVAVSWWTILWVALVIFAWILLVPLWVVLAVLPTAGVSWVVTWVTVWRASRVVRRARPQIIAITGSFGKTSTKQLLAAVLSQSQAVFVTPKSHNTRLSVARSILAGYRGESVMILEFAAYTRGEIAALAAWFPPTVGVVTGLAPQHLGLFGTLAAIAQAKAELVKALPPGAPIWYAADTSAPEIVAAANRSDLIRKPYQASDCADWQPRLSPAGRLVLQVAGRSVELALVGRQYLAAISLARRWGQSAGLRDEVIVAALVKFQPETGVTRSFYHSTGALVIDDGGSSNPAGFQAAMAVMAELKQQGTYTRVILVTAGIVDLGAESARIHQELAAAARPVFDQVWLVAENGLPEWQAAFGEQLVTAVPELVTAPATWDAQTLVLIEGRMPGWWKVGA